MGPVVTGRALRVGRGENLEKAQKARPSEMVVRVQ